ncbi:1108_t:CDS:2 [Funneliformis caledonium]|uniref:1108_t:CDS:1 n=1 Tax=Funneliformis caledonium TaxID=1117310 RepID=A0A9N9I8G4_9GLOM|nr:1108_t:CDS:2 [Funneliformis caledonium]
MLLNFLSTLIHRYFSTPGGTCIVAFGGLNIISLPMFNDATWFNTLSDINKKLDEQEAKYDNVRAFLQNIKSNHG